MVLRDPRGKAWVMVYTPGKKMKICYVEGGFLLWMRAGISTVMDIRQWEYIAFCLSQLTLSEKGLKKLIESFKSYEHALSQDSVMDHFRSIISKCKKFAKAELKSCIEEFDEKLQKIHQERKEQEMIARNAQVHQQKVASLEGLVASNKGAEEKIVDGDNGGESAEEKIVDGDNGGEGAEEKIVDGDNGGEVAMPSENGEVINPSTEENITAGDNQSEVKDMKSEESCVSSLVTECDAEEIEVQSPKIPRKAVTKPKAARGRRSVMPDSVDVGAIRRTTRSSRR